MIMEFKELKHEIIRIEELKANYGLTETGLNILDELKELLKQRDEMLEMLKLIRRRYSIQSNTELEIDKLIEEATKIY